MNFVYEIIFFNLTIAIAAYQAHLIKENRAIIHWLWDIIFGAEIVLFWLLAGKNYWLLGALVLLHLIFFSAALNLFRQKPFFYISSQGPHGSLWDKIFLQLPKLYEALWLMALIFFISIQFKL